MKRLASVSLALAFAALRLATVAEAARPQADLQRETAIAEATPKIARSNSVYVPIPQLSANTNTGPEVPMAREIRPPATSPATAAAPPAAAPQPLSPGWLILAVLIVLAGSYFLKRLRSKSGPS